MALKTRRIGMTVAGAAIAAMAIVATASQTNAVQGSARVRGNVPGEWRYWGADAWSTRYSPLDQINASNFGSLEVAWQWSASPLGADEYYRTTPLFANGRIFTVAMRLAAALRASGLPCEGINLFLADGEAAFQEVFHTHLHVFPRFAGDTFRISADWSLTPPREELDRLAALIRGSQVRDSLLADSG